MDERLSGKGNSISHGARPVNQIITMIKWIRASGLSMNSLYGRECDLAEGPHLHDVLELLVHVPQREHPLCRKSFWGHELDFKVILGG